MLGKDSTVIVEPDEYPGRQAPYPGGYSERLSERRIDRGHFGESPIFSVTPDDFATRPSVDPTVGRFGWDVDFGIFYEESFGFCR